MAIHVLTQGELNQEWSEPQVKAGTYMEDEMGRVWCHVQTSATLTKGQALTPAAAVINATVDTVAAVDTRRVTTTADFTTTALAHQATPERPNGHTYYFWTNATAAQNQGGPIIRRVSDASIDVYFINSDDGRIATQLEVTSDYEVFTPSRVRVSQAITNMNVITGFAQKAVTAEYWFWMLVRGMGVCDWDESDTAGAMGLGLVQSSTAGEMQGADVNGAGAEADGGISAYGFMDTDADGLLIFCADCPIMAGIPIPVNKTTEYPALIK